jgi:hypothetical protein
MYQTSRRHYCILVKVPTHSCRVVNGAEFMAAYDTGKMILFVCSIPWDLDIPQEAVTILYKDNDACTAMGNA